MNSTLKHWKEAATLILAAGHRLCPNGLRTRTPPVSTSSLLGRSDPRTHIAHTCFDYDVLMLKRSGKSGFMPNAYVFPGGLADSSDFSSEWLDIFTAFQRYPTFGLGRIKQPAKTRPPIFATDRLELGSPIPGEVAFRICALRETFEESGVLLVVPKTDEKLLLKSIEDTKASGDMPLTQSGMSTPCTSELTKWRALVNQNPANFIRMCRELEVLPNIWALHEWGNWLTPKDRYRASRFDTAFFICFLKEIPHTLQDKKEIQDFKWSTPSEVLQSYGERELWIAPPQYYELSRMCRFPLLSELHMFSSRRATEGCEQWMPVVLSKDDHFIMLLPGDKLYPSDSLGESAVDSISDQENSPLHRMVVKDPYTINVKIDITPKYNHLLPILRPPQPLDSQGKL